MKNENGNPKILRDVERKMKEAFKRDGLLIHIKGRRGMGKLSTTILVLKELQKPFEQIQVVCNDEQLIVDLNTAMKSNAGNLSEIGLAMEKHVRNGFIFELYEIQNSTTFKVSFIDREHLEGGIIIMGSFPQLVNEILDYSKPLFGRFTISFTISPFSVLESKGLMDFFGIVDPMLLLTFYSICDGNPSLYKILHQQELLRNNVSRSELENVIIPNVSQELKSSNSEICDTEKIVSFKEEKIPAKEFSSGTY